MVGGYYSDSQYKSNGYNIVMDVESGAVHVVDDVTYVLLHYLKIQKPQRLLSSCQISMTRQTLKKQLVRLIN